MENIVTPANTVLFEDFCNTLERLHKIKKQKQEQVKILGQFIDDLKLNVSRTAGKKNASLFPILRLLIPTLERERPAYNLKESKLGALLVKVLALRKQSPDAVKLLNFRSVSSSQDNDFAGVAYFVLKNRVSLDPGKLTIGDVNETLDKIASAEIGNKGLALDGAFSYALKNLSADQLKWFLRIILKDLKLGMGVNRILACFHPDAPELYESCGNLSKVCEDLEEGDSRPLELGIQLFYAVSPMLSERLDITNVRQLPADRTYQVEEKFDGERFQVHMENGVFEYFSRKGHSFVKTYGKTYDGGLLTPFLKDCFSAKVSNFILDGEMMGWHKQNQCFGTKGMSFDVKKITETSKFRPCFCAFDVLYYNGKTLVGPQEKGGLPLGERLKLLDEMFTDIPGVIQHSKRQIVKSSSDILDALNTAMENQEEGIVVKDTQSYYIANRRSAGWYKIKPEYTEGTMTDLDLVIIGADEAENKRQGRAKSFLVACVDVAPGGEGARWVCVGRVASGLAGAERERVCAALERRWTHATATAPATAPAPPPPALVFNKIKPDFWIMPEHSIVLEVRATELVRSSHFGTAYTLRFARIMRVRDDKPVQDILTLDEFNNLAANKGSVVKLSTKRVNEEQIADEGIKTRRKRTAKLPQVAEQFRVETRVQPQVGGAEGGVEGVAGDGAGDGAGGGTEGGGAGSGALVGRRLCVLSPDDHATISDLKRIIESHGGTCVPNIGPDTWCCIVGNSTAYTRKVIESRAADVASAAWLRALRPSPCPCPCPSPGPCPSPAPRTKLRPLDLLAARRDTRLALAAHYDTFGDGYKEMTDEATLRMCFDKMDKEGQNIYLTSQEMLNVDAELFGDTNPYSYLRRCSIHFINCKDLNVIWAKMYGAAVSDGIGTDVTHVVIARQTETEEIERVKEKYPNAVTVSEEWLETCFTREMLVSEDIFLL